MNPGDFPSKRAGCLAEVPAQEPYLAFVPNVLPPAITWDDGLVSLLSEADRAVAGLEGIGRSLPNPHLLMMPFVRQEAVLSSRIEGTQTTLLQLYAFEAWKEVRPDMPADVREVRNHVVALEHGLELLQTTPVSRRLLCAVHAKLMEGVRGERWRPGEFRDGPVYVGPPGLSLADAPFVPPPVPEMQQALDDLERFLNTDLDMPALVRIAISHYQFEAIHPFFDGNGRVGRLLIILLLCAWGLLTEPLLYLSAYFERHRQDYYDALMAVSQRGAWEAWLCFFLDGVRTQALDATRRAQRLEHLRQSYRVRIQASASPTRLFEAVDLLFRQPIITAASVAQDLGVGRSTAHRYVQALQDTGIILEMTGRSRDREYIAHEIIRAIQDPLPHETEA